MVVLSTGLGHRRTWCSTDWRGEMSFVGPRPVTRAELSKYYRDAAAEVLDLKPKSYRTVASARPQSLDLFSAPPA